MSPPSGKEAGMQMSERQWQILSLLDRLNRGEVTVGEVAASLVRSKRQVHRMRKWLAGNGAAALVHGNSGRSPKHRTSQEVRERVLVLRRDKYAGFNDQHFTEKLLEVEGLELSRETARRILRAASLASQATSAKFAVAPQDTQLAWRRAPSDPHQAAGHMCAALREEGPQEPHRAYPRACPRYPETAELGPRDLRG